ncbi:MAG: OprO/OprP family phosphate-selective porin [Bacteroidaceae bacterium]|nr:OprO/OprP family phosphate-selective porin [Bacteroidaceae bacterium]
MRNTAFALLALVTGVATAQVSTGDNEATLFERVSKIEKKSDKFNLFFNMHYALDADFTAGNFDQGAFNMHQFRIEAKGKVTDWLSYRWRQRLNRCNDGGGFIDNLPNSIDLAYLNFSVTDKFNISAGKLCAAYGGIEFDMNPIEIYRYSEIINNMSNFMSGVMFTYDFNPNQQLAFQVLDSRNGSIEDTYGANLDANKLPFVYTLNWNANMFDGAWQTRWSASVMDEVKDKYMYYVALGNQFNFSPKCNMFVDLMSSYEQLDRKGIMTNIFDGQDNFGGHNMYNTLYSSLVAKVNWRFQPKWNFFVKGMLESAAIYGGDANDGIYNGGNVANGNYRTSVGYLTGVEYYPMESNLHLFLTFVGQTHLFTERAKALGQNDYSTQRVSVGFIYQLPVY